MLHRHDPQGDRRTHNAVRAVQASAIGDSDAAERLVATAKAISAKGKQIKPTT